MEIYREDVARFRALVGAAATEDPLTVLDHGGVPHLRALQLHNSTVYRWNRPCYGVHEGRAHLRIENRILPSGPSSLDEIAKAVDQAGVRACLCYEVTDRDGGEAARAGIRENVRFIRLAQARQRLYAGFEGAGLWQAPAPTGPWQPAALTAATILDLAVQQDTTADPPVERLYASSATELWLKAGPDESWQAVPLPGLTVAELEQVGESPADKFRPGLFAAPDRSRRVGPERGDGSPCERRRPRDWASGPGQANMPTRPEGDPLRLRRAAGRSLDDALAQGQPTVFVLDSYAFRPNAACGGALGILHEVFIDYPGLTVIHAEPWHMAMGRDGHMLELDPPEGPAVAATIAVLIGGFMLHRELEVRT